MASAEVVDGRPTALRRAMILATLTLITMLYAMTVTIANVALPQMQGALSATQDQIAWVVTFNLVATAIATPMTGWLTSRFGRRNLALCGVLGFTVSSILCGTASSLPELVFFRLLQGAFGAPLVPLSQAIVLDTYPRHQHGAVMAFFGMGVVIGPIIAPTLGGVLSEAYGWRWVFFMIVPFGVISFLGVWTFIKRRVGAREEVRLDWTGFLALAVAIGAFQLMLDRGERNDWFDSAEIAIECGIAVVAFYIFIAHSLTASRPFLSPRLLRDRNFALGLFFVTIFGMLNFTPMVLLPPLLQDLRDYPDSIIGLLLGARGVGTLVGFIMMLWASKFDPRVILGIGFLLQAVAGFAMSTFSLDLTTWDVAWTSAVQGLGVGLIWVPLTLITFATLESRYVPDGAAIFHLLRNLGSSIFISISVAVVIRTTNINYADLVNFASPLNEAFNYPWARGGWSLDSTAGLAGLAGEIQRQARMIGYINAFYMFAITATLVVPFLLFVRMPKK